MLRVESVSKGFTARKSAEVRALDGVDLAVDPGELVAVVGPSGSGKSTLLFTAAGLSRPDAGRVTVGGADLYAIPASKRSALRRTEIGLVFQTFNLVPYLTCEENVALPAMLAGRTRRDALAASRALLERLGLAARARHRPAELSVGERQRVAIGRSVINSPKLILADEPTGNLDPVTSAGVVDLLLELAADGRAVVMVTHDPVIAQLANRVVELTAGRVTDIRERRRAERAAS
jgi:putative ABC transport system ATP-binding protein